VTVEKSRFVNKEDLANEFRLKPGQIRNLIENRILPYRRPPRSRAVLWERSVVEAWLEAGKVESIADEVRRRVKL
jgi:hypothetical protein